MKVAGYRLIAETPKAYLLHHKKRGDFWVPKSLIRDDEVWDHFSPQYLPKELPDQDMQDLSHLSPEKQELFEKVEARCTAPKKKVIMVSTPMGAGDKWFIEEFLGVK